MPIILKKKPDEDTVLAVWKITESKAELQELLHDGIRDTHASRPDQLHWLASRLLLGNLFEGRQVLISKDAFNKPHLHIDGLPYHLSITHSHSYAAVIVSEHKTVSIDMEQIDPRIDRVKHKFVTDAELALCKDCGLTEFYTIVWSAKESLYKYYSRKELDFREHLHITSFDGPRRPLQGRIHKNGFDMLLSIHIEAIEEYVLTYIV